jgi:GntR family transcriptional repressor for pyruvate dehydrogenase complex
VIEDGDSGSGAPAPNRSGGMADRIISDLQAKILQGHYPRGSKLPSERELAQYYAVSGPTVREAIRGLAAMSLVESRRGAGVIVIAATGQLFSTAINSFIEAEQIQLSEILEVLEALYVKGAALICLHASDAELEGLVAALARLDRTSEPTERSENLRLFLNCLADASHNPLMSMLCKMLVDLLARVSLEQVGGIARNWERIAARLKTDRREFVEALCARDAALASVLAASYHHRTKQLVAGAMAADANGAADRMRIAFGLMRQTA